MASFTPLVLPAGSFDAYLFDLDGTIADSMGLHYIAWTRTLAQYGASFPEHLFYAWGGVPPLEIVERLNLHFGYTLDPVETVHRKEGVYLATLDQLQPVAAVLAHVEASSGSLPFAIVSGSPRASILRTLEILGLTQHFPLIVGAEDYAHGKPHPEPFLRAAELLGVAPGRCLVFEDAEAGIASAMAAGMQVVRVPMPEVALV